MLLSKAVQHTGDVGTGCSLHPCSSLSVWLHPSPTCTSTLLALVQRTVPMYSLLLLPGSCPCVCPSASLSVCVCVCGADKVLCLAGQGSGGYEELLQHFDQAYVQFGALKVIGKDNRQTLEAFRPKYVFFTFIGDKVSVLQRAKVSVQRGAAEKIFNGYSTRLDVPGNLSNFTRLEISKELLKCGGAHTPSHYIFGPGDEVEVKNLEQMS